MLDLFAGSGAMGLEALSRGAARAVFVESDPRACRAINENLDKLRLTGAQVLCQDVVALPRDGAPRASTSSSATRRTSEFERLQPRARPPRSGLLAEDGLLVLETRRAQPEPELAARDEDARAATAPRALRSSSTDESPRSAQAATTRSRTATST